MIEVFFSVDVNVYTQRSTRYSTSLPDLRSEKKIICSYPYFVVISLRRAITQLILLPRTEAVRSEVKDTNVTLTALLPGATDTDFFNKADMQQSKIVQEEKLDDPADVAKDGYEAMMRGDDKSYLRVEKQNAGNDGKCHDRQCCRGKDEETTATQ